MAGVFPNGVKQFAIHRNLFDDVNAEHINAIQEEIVAIETSLGPALLDVEELFDNDVLEKKRFKNLRERLDWIWSGGHTHVATLFRSQFLVATQVLGYQKPLTTNFPAPNAAADPHNMFNGVGLTSRVDGWYLIVGHGRWDLSFGNENLNEAVYHCEVGIGPDEKAEDRVRVSVDRKTDIMHNPVYIGRVSKGTKINLRFGHNSPAPNRQVGNARLSAVLLRRA